MTKIAIISDIHSNLYALEAFMNYIETTSDIAYILNMGDFLQIGPHPREVYDIVMNDSRFLNIMSNGEYMFFNEEVRKHYEKEALHQEWVRNQLGSERMERLKQVLF